jgi:hypothetical protein
VWHAPLPLNCQITPTLGGAFIACVREKRRVAGCYPSQVARLITSPTYPHSIGKAKSHPELSHACLFLPRRVILRGAPFGESLSPRSLLISMPVCHANTRGAGSKRQGEQDFPYVLGVEGRRRFSEGLGGQGIVTEEARVVLLIELPNRMKGQMPLLSEYRWSGR